MTIPNRIYHKDQAVSRLLDVFKKPNIEAMVRLYAEQLDDIESLLYILLNIYDIDTMTGVQLETIGEIVGQSKQGVSDEDYRKLLRFKIGVNNSEGTIPYLLDLIKVTTESTISSYIPLYPAGYHMSFNGDYIPINFLDTFTSASPVCVNFGLIHDKDDSGWIPSELGSVESISDRAVLPEISAVSDFYYPPEIYEKNINTPDPIPADINKALLKASFSLDDFTGTGTSLPVNNGLDVAGNGAAVLHFRKGSTSILPSLFSPVFGDNVRCPAIIKGATLPLSSSMTYSGSGFVVGTNSNVNSAAAQYTTATLMKSTHFADMISWVGDGTSFQQVPHNLDHNVAAIIPFSDDASFTGAFWFKGMSSVEFFNGTSSIQEVGAIWGGSLPTSTHISVGDVGSSISMNKAGVSYQALIIADNEEAGIRVDTYIATGIAGQEVVTGIDNGLLLIANASTSTPRMVYSVLNAPWGGQIPTGTSNSDRLDVITTGDSFILASTNNETNKAGDTYYYLCIQNPKV